MMLRATAGCNVAVYDAWESDVAVNTEDASFRSVSSQPAGIYKSTIATGDLWTLFTKVCNINYWGSAYKTSQVYMLSSIWLSYIVKGVYGITSDSLNYLFC